VDTRRVARNDRQRYRLIIWTGGCRDGHAPRRVPGIPVNPAGLIRRRRLSAATLTRQTLRRAARAHIAASRPADLAAAMALRRVTTHRPARTRRYRNPGV
jgi:hypothetical protein